MSDEIKDNGLMQTDRGFYYTNFIDANGIACSVQESSAIRFLEGGEETTNLLWLGCNDIGLKHFVAGKGWQDVELIHTEKEHYSANTRMHLTQEQAAALIPLLQRFSDRGTLAPKPKKPVK